MSGWSSWLKWLRPFRRNPGFCVIVTAIFAIGIAAATSVFALVDAFFLRPLPFTDEDRLVHVWRVDLRGSGLLSMPSRVSLPDFVDFERQTRSLTSLGAFSSSEFNIGSENPERLLGTSITPNVFEILGVPPLLGRTFHTGEKQRGSQVVVLSRGLWQRKFGGSADAIGQTLVIGGLPHEVIGVMPATFEFPLRQNEFWIPLAKEQRGLSRDQPYAQLVGRLKPGVTRGAAQADLATVSRQLEASYPDRQRGLGVSIVSLRAGLLFYYDVVRLMAILLAGAAAVLVLTICSNGASLIFARNGVRAPEIAVRSALGASRRQLVGTLLGEAMSLAALGAALGALLSRWLTTLLESSVPIQLYRVGRIELDARAFGFAALTTMAVVLLTALRPALQTTRMSITSGVAMAQPALGRVRGRGRTGWLLVAAQLASSVMLGTVATLLVAIVFQLRDAPPGFRSNGVLVTELSVPRLRYRDNAAVSRFFEELASATRRLPGVTSVALVYPLPLTGQLDIMQFTIEGRPLVRPQDRLSALAIKASPDYFATMGIPILRGRGLSRDDRSNTTPVAVISRTAADSYWPNEDPIGKRMFDCSVCTADRGSLGLLTIVGIVEDVKQAGLWDAPRPQVYTALDQAPARDVSMAVRMEGDVGRLAASIRTELARLDPNLPFGTMRTMTDQVAASMQPMPAIAAALSGMAACAVFLAALGVYGVLEMFISQRLREIGVRLSLGASHQHIYRLVLRIGLMPASVGVTVGVVVSVGVVLATSTVLQGTAGVTASVSARAVLQSIMPALIATAVLLVAVVAACVMPARRAARVDPVLLLRYE